MAEELEELDDYEKKCKEIEKRNGGFLNLFEEELKFAGLSNKVIQKHLSNVDFYLNVYLLRDGPLNMEDGTSELGEYLGYFFIRKCMWSTPSSIKSTAASIKKFYKCMLDNGKIKKEAYEYLCSDIKYNMEEWQEDCRQYNNPDEPNPFFFF